ncbi:MAG: cysteine--tRNA ligase [Desulfovibrio sp.]|nr:cysteine--tRNA ligase [Desulfovibrio sp.]
MLLYNSLTRKKEEFIPVDPGRVRVYVCGITAYDYCHIGHARSAIVFDALTRHLRNLGLDVLFIRNFTDIDDKIINRANSEGRDWREVSQTYIEAFNEDMERLGVQRPNIAPKATDYIEQIIDLCKKLIDEGYAYPAANGDVYFRVRAYKPYGKLSGRNLDDMRAGARVAPGEEKEDDLDFALWKSSKPGEPSWPSPWGEGRPGWHIECSAMNQPFLPLDIHGGGQDLIFPHHENEIAQSEAVCHCQLARYWMHNGFVRIESEKMSKSLGNFKTIRGILEDWTPETLRFFLLGKHYRSPIDFDGEAMEEAEKGLRRIYLALKDAAEATKRSGWKKTPLPDGVLEEWQAIAQNFRDAMNDDLNTAQAIGHIFAATRLVNGLLEDKKARASEKAGIIFEGFLASATEWSRELGVLGRDPGDFLNDLRLMRAKRKKINMERAKELLERRDAARKNKDYALSDSLRDELASMGIETRDTPGGQEWDIA